ncbi:MAG: formate dehydrogenase accessory protein FdhE [Eggerthellaceae bacterium]|nr:formate dehydrogenase accessory protein FdhE [Eggerthellaceae bacterium]
MNLYAIEASVTHYLKDANEQDSALLTFYQGLWKLLYERADELEKAHEYQTPTKDAVEEAYWTYQPLFMQYPPMVEVSDFSYTLELVATYIAEHAGLDDLAKKAIQDINWRSVAENSDLKIAVTYPPQYIEDVLSDPEKMGLSHDVSISVVGLVVAYALRAHIMNPAQVLMRKAPLSADQQGQHTRPLNCPVCGGTSTSGFVGETASSDGMGTELFCSTCGITWPFERIRCAQCGEQDQNKLHYFNIEGDNAHRLHTCDTCGSYTRKVFQEDIDEKAGLCMDVEDVVMARLDALAQDPKFYDKAQPNRPQHG